ncbi:MAG: PEP/pyruvate-binding domain-containing protein [Candidatus Omnitrophota bacterium]|jgi:hypothetical protein
MIKFKKPYNLNILIITISFLYFSSAWCYASNLSRYHLRVPITGYDRLNDAESKVLLADLKKFLNEGDDWNAKLVEFAEAIGKDRLTGIHASPNLGGDNLKKYIKDFLAYGDPIRELENILKERDENASKASRRFIVKSAYRDLLGYPIDIKSYPVSERKLLKDLLIKLSDKPQFHYDAGDLKKIVRIFGLMYDPGTFEYIDSTHKVSALMYDVWSASEYLHESLMPQSNIVGTIRYDIHRKSNAKKTLDLVSNYLNFIDTGETRDLFKSADQPKTVDFDLRTNYMRKESKALEVYELLLEIRNQLSMLVTIASQEKLKLLNIWLIKSEMQDSHFVQEAAVFAKSIADTDIAVTLKLISDFRIRLKEKIFSARGAYKFELLELDYAIEKVLLYNLGGFYDFLNGETAENGLTMPELAGIVLDLGILLDCDYVSPMSTIEFAAGLSDFEHNTLSELKDICKTIRGQYEAALKMFNYNYGPFIKELSSEKKDIQPDLEDKLTRFLLRREYSVEAFIHATRVLEARLRGASEDDKIFRKNAPPVYFMQMENTVKQSYKNSLYIRRLYGGKAASLAAMARLGFAVPQAFFISLTTDYDEEKNMGELKNNVSMLEQAISRQEGTSLKFGDTNNPLLVSVRSGSFLSFPGAMNTIPFVGINDEIAEAIAEKTGNAWLAYDSYRRFLEAYGMYILNMNFKIFDDMIDAKKLESGVTRKEELNAPAMKSLAFKYKKAIEKAGYKDELERILKDPYQALSAAVKNINESWYSREAIAHRRLRDISDDWGTGVIVQKMVFGNFKTKNPISGTAVIFSHDKLDKTQKLTGEFYPNAYGGDIVGGLVKPYPIERFKIFIGEEEYMQIENYVKILSEINRFPQEIEITVEEGQTRWLQFRDNDLFVQHEYAPFYVKEEPVLTGSGVSGGTITGKVIFKSKDAIHMNKKAEAKGLDGAILILREAKLPQDITSEELESIVGFISVLGGPSSHLAQFTAINGKTAVIGLSKDLMISEDKGYAWTADGVVSIKEGDVLSIDGNPSSGKIYKGALEKIKNGSIAKQPVEILSCI